MEFDVTLPKRTILEIELKDKHKWYRLDKFSKELVIRYGLYSSTNPERVVEIGIRNDRPLIRVINKENREYTDNEFIFDPDEFRLFYEISKAFEEEVK